jgi:AcrR family transcriptional regulator
MSSTNVSFARARSEEQRRERREAILATAARMLETTRVSELSLNELAREVGLAKSNVLRYFESREAVLLELFDREYRAWLDDLQARLEHLTALTIDDRIEQIALAVAESVDARPVFCELCASAPGVLEHNVSATVAADYKRSAVANAERLGELLGPLLGDPSRASLLTLVGGINLVIGGVWAMSQPSPGMAKAYAENADLAAMRLDLCLAVRELVATLLVGLRHRQSRP